MSVVLYKPGNTGKVRGIPCEVLVCDEYSYLHHLEQGYFYSPEECYAKKESGEEEAEEPAAQEESPEPASKGDEDAEPEEPVLTEPSEDEIRAKAKDAGIKSWHVKSLDRLKVELEEREDGERSEE